MPRRIIDPSMPIEDDVFSNPPGYGPKGSCFPVKIRCASAGWTRAVAILGE